MTQKGFAPILILLGVLGLVLVAGGVYLGTKIRQPADQIQPQNQIISQTSTPTPLASSSASSAETANWKTYQGPLFEFKYPPNGTIKSDDSTGISVGHDEGNEPPYWGFTVSIEDNSNNLTTKQVVDKIISDLRNNKFAPGANSQADQTQQTMQDYTNGQINGIKLQSFDEGYPQKFGKVIEATKNKIYNFSISDGTGGGVSDKDEKLLDQILSTFKFTDQNQTTNSGWLIYEDTLMSYKISYPVNWKTEYMDYSYNAVETSDELKISDPQSNSKLIIYGNGQRSGCRDDTPEAQTQCHEVVTTFKTPSGLTGYKAAFDQNSPSVINQYTFRIGKSNDFGKNYVEIRPGLLDSQLPVELQIINTISEI